MGRIQLRLLVTIWASLALAQDSFREQVVVTAVSTVVRWDDPKAGGRPGPEQLEVFFDGRSAQVLSVEPLLPEVAADTTSPSQLVSPADGLKRGAVSGQRSGTLVLLVRGLCSARNRDAAVEKLRAYADGLVRMGPVLLAVSPSSSGEEKLCETSDELRKQLSLLTTIRVENWQIKLRKEAQSLFTVGLDVDRVGAFYRAEEIVRIRGLLQALKNSLLQYSAGRRLVFLIWDGFDLQLQGVYGFFPQSDQSRSRDQTKTGGLGSVGLLDANFLAEVRELAGLLANLGVPVVSLNPGYMAGYSPAWSAQFRRPAVSPEVFGRGSVAADELLTVAPHEPLEYLAEETGGVVIPPRESLAEGLKRLEDAYLLWFQVPMAPDGKTYALEVRAKDPRVRVWAPKAITLGSPGGQAVAWAREVVERGYLSDGELAPQITLEVERVEGKSQVGRLRVSTDLRAVRALVERLRQAHLRVTVGVHMRKGEPFVHQEEFQQAVDERSGGTVWTYEAPISLPKEAERLAVVVEELQTGAWGAAVLDLKGEGKP